MSSAKESNTAENCRRNLNSVLITVLSKGEKVSDTYVSETLMKCIVQCMEEFPQIFVYPQSSITLDENKTNKFNNKENECNSFTTWLVGRLVQILSLPCYSNAQLPCINVVVSLMNFLNIRNINMYKVLLSELNYSLSDLISISDRLFSGDNTVEKFELKHFLVPAANIETIKDASDLDLRDMPIFITDPLQCEHLQVSLTLVLKKLMFTLSRYISDEMLFILWQSLCCHLELGDIPLKQVSLDAINELIFHVGLPRNINIQEYFASCLEALVEFVCSRIPIESSGDEITLLEDSLAKSFENIFELYQQQSYFLTFYNPTITQILTKILQVFITHGLIKVKNKKLQYSFGNMLLLIANNFFNWNLIQLQKLQQLLRHFLFSCIDAGHYQQWLPKCFIGLIRTEASYFISTNALTWPRNSTMDVDTNNEDDKKGLDSIRKANFDQINDQMYSLSVTETGRIDSSFISITWKLLKHKLQENLQKAEISSEKQLNCLQIYEVLKIILEIGIQCSVYFRSLSAIDNCRPSELPSDSNITMLQFKTEAKYNLEWLIPNIETIIVKNSTELLQHVSTYTVVPLFSLFKIILNLFKTIIFAQDLFNLSMEEYRSMAVLCSLPWYKEEKLPNELVIREDFKCLAPIAEMFKQLTDKDLQIQITKLCLEIISIFPRDLMTDLQIQAYYNILHDEENELLIFAIKLLPVLLHQVGNDCEKFSNMLTRCLQFKREDAQETLAALIGKLSCTLSDKTVLERLQIFCLEDISYVMNVKCISCDDNIVKDQVQDLTQPFAVEPSFILSFLQNLSFRSNKVRLAFIHNFKAVFHHVPPNSEIMSACLNLIESSSYEVRIAMSQNIHHILINLSGEVQCKAEEMIVSKLKSVYVNATNSKNIRLQETVLLTIGQLGRIADGDLLLVVIISLLENLLSPIPLMKSTAHLQLIKIGKAKKVKMTVLFMKFKQPICKFLLETLHSSQPQDPNQSMDILYEIVNVFEFGDLKSFLTATVRYLLPHLVIKATTEASILLKSFSKQLQMNRREMLVNNISYIFSHLVCYCSGTEMERALLYIQKETEIEIGSLLRCDYQRTTNVLLLHISTHYQQVFDGLVILASKDETYEGKKDIKMEADLAEFLQPRLLGFLTFFDSLLSNASISIEEKKLALESLVCIIRLMGQKHITTVRMKVIATLKITLDFQDKGFPELCCNAWDTFVHSVELSSLGPMLSQIIVMLLPLLKIKPDEVAKIFHFLIVECRESLQEHFHDLHLIPDLPELAVVNAVLKEHNEKPSSQEDFCSLLLHSFKSISHENIDVRILALSKLKNLLQNYKVALHDLILKNDTIDPIIPQLVSVLLAGCREPTSKARILIGECLGELGAIDPGRLMMKCNKLNEDTRKQCFIVEAENFAFELLNELVRAYLAADNTRIQDCSSYAMQEILQIYECSDSHPPSSSGGKLWNNFSEHVKEILFPFLRSRYKMGMPVKWTNVPTPIYRSGKGDTFQNWICYWTGYLVTKIKQEKAAKVFHACSMIIKHNTNTALYLLPHIILYALQDGSSQDIDEIYKEILAVLSQFEVQGLKKMEQLDFDHMSTQTIFSVLDHLTKWTQIKRNIKEASGYNVVKEFLDKIPQDLLASASYECKAYTRALIHLEAYIKSGKTSLQKELSNLQELYATLNEPDAVAGVLANLDREPTLHEQILAHGSTGQLQDAFACYERVIHVEPNDVSHHQGLLKCLMGLDQFSTALTYAHGVLMNRPEWSQTLNQYCIEAAWKLGNWDGLETFLKKDNLSNSFDVGIGRILLSAKKKDESLYQKLLKETREEQVGPLCAASMEDGAYQRCYENLVRLHMLNELERSMKVFFGLEPTLQKSFTEDPIYVENLLKEWDCRLEFLQSSMRYLEPILNLRRVILGLSKENAEIVPDDIDQHISSCWLQSAKVARKSGHMQCAHSFLLETLSCKSLNVSVEKAKWHWQKGEKEQAMLTLQKGLKENYPDTLKLKAVPSSSEISEKLIYAKAKLLLARYSEESANLESGSIMKMYKEVQEIHPQWEDGHFYLARYLDKVIHSIEDPDKRAGEMQILIVKSYGQSLIYGCQYIYHSMPRMLSVWLDFGSRVAKMEKSKSTGVLQNHQRILNVINSRIFGFSEKLPPYQFLTAFPQLISRICHSHSDVFARLKEIIAKLLATFPQQSMWMITAVSKSTYAVRVKRCQEIFSRAKELNPNLHKFLQDSNKLTDKLLELSNKPVEQGVSTMSINSHFRPIQRLVDDRNFSQIVLPLQNAMTVMLPTTSCSHQNHNPFPHKLVYIQSFVDTIEIMPSLQKPKKITIVGSDGNKYIVMCKPKDDLRKDCRLMEFNSLMNKSLLQDVESRRRQLHIRTYAVIPLNEECGLIEWVPNLTGLRPILTQIYREKNMYTSGKDLKSLMVTLDTPLEQKLSVFKNKLLPRHPPVFSEWFLRTFPDPTTWYMARCAYARTTAVMSMVGYILGLGDRHGENILFDASCGDTVHVDFNCLFNKGETFDWPERVPFRLTHNMTDAMGPTSFEGIYRKACEATLRVMRDQMDTLMSVLRPFIHDPLVEWSKPSRGSRSAIADSGEIDNEKARTHVLDIEYRLKGTIKNKNKSQNFPLSIEGQVNYLIQEATDEKNLCQMYIGWAAYM